MLIGTNIFEVKKLTYLLVVCNSLSLNCVLSVTCLLSSGSGLRLGAVGIDVMGRRYQFECLKLSVHDHCMSKGENTVLDNQHHKKRSIA